MRIEYKNLEEALLAIKNYNSADLERYENKILETEQEFKNKISKVSPCIDDEVCNLNVDGSNKLSFKKEPRTDELFPTYHFFGNISGFEVVKRTYKQGVTRDISIHKINFPEDFYLKPEKYLVNFINKESL